MLTLSEMLVKIKMQPFSHLNSQTPLISIYGSPKGTIGLRNICARKRALKSNQRQREESQRRLQENSRWRSQHLQKYADEDECSTFRELKVIQHFRTQPYHYYQLPFTEDFLDAKCCIKYVINSFHVIKSSQYLFEVNILRKLGDFKQLS